MYFASLTQASKLETVEECNINFYENHKITCIYFVAFKLVLAAHFPTPYWVIVEARVLDLEAFKSVQDQLIKIKGRIRISGCIFKCDLVGKNQYDFP